MITGAQIKAARSLLGWTTTTLARQSGQPVRIITLIEDGLKIPTGLSDNTFRRIRRALEDGNIEFTQIDDDPGSLGVRLRTIL